MDKKTLAIGDDFWPQIDKALIKVSAKSENGITNIYTKALREDKRIFGDVDTSTTTTVHTVDITYKA